MIKRRNYTLNILLIFLGLFYLPLIFTAFAYGSVLDLIYMLVYILNIILILQLISKQNKKWRNYFILFNTFILLLNIRFIFEFLEILKGTDVVVLIAFILGYLYHLIVCIYVLISDSLKE